MNTALALAATIIAMMMLPGCEETADITDAVYRERIVVNGVLDADSAVVVSFSRTLPINESYSATKAMLTDVDARIIEVDPAHPGISTSYPLVNVEGDRYSAGRLRPVPGFEYRLEASWHGRSVRGRTRIPVRPTVDSVMFVAAQWRDQGPEEYLVVRAVVEPKPGDVYMLASAGYSPVSGKPMFFGGYTSPMARLRDTASNGSLVLVEEWQTYAGIDSAVAAVVAYDEPYYEFQRTYERGDDRGPFGSGADIVRWTVEGDGLGLFIGRSVRFVPVYR